MVMKWIKLDEDAIIPTRATERSAGYDVYANETVLIQAGEVASVKTGITFKGLASNEFIQMSLRSGTSLNRPLLMANGVGIIDSDYAGWEMGIILYNRSSKIPVIIDKGDKLAQCIILKYGVAEEEPVLKKRVGGFGSTGTK